MAKKELSPFEQETVEVATKVLDYKLAAEANVVSILYKHPEELFNVDLTLNDFTNNVWRVFFQIAYDIILVEKKSTLDDIVIGLYLEKHEKLREKYEEYGGYDTIQAAAAYVKRENLEAYIAELRKWKAVIELCKKGFPVKDKLSQYVDKTEEEIYNEFEVYLNHIFTNTTSGVKSYNVFDDMFEFIDELNNSQDVGVPFYNAPLLTEATGGFNLNGNIYGLGAGSGVGKSTMAFNYLVPTAIEHGEKVVFIINEEDERKMRKELLIWVANNVFKEELQKRTIRDGNFNKETLELLIKCAKWIEEKKEQHIFTVIPLERYSVKTVVKIIKKYSGMGVRMFVLDTLKESSDAGTDEIFKSMMRDMVTLYDTVKPSARNVGLFVTYQLGKGSLKMRYLTNNEIGQAKSIIDVMSVNFMMRRPYEDEYVGGSKELKCFRVEKIGKGSVKEVGFALNKKDNPMITFITKNRFGISGGNQIVSYCDFSRNICSDEGYCCVPQDF